jgi:hypothetical protein
VSLSRVKDIEGLYLERPGETTCEFVILHLTRAFENTLMSVYTRNLTSISLSRYSYYGKHSSISASN